MLKVRLFTGSGPYTDSTSRAGPTKLIVTLHLQFTQLHLVLVPTLTPTSSTGPTKLIVTPHLQFTQLQLVEVFLETLRPVVNKGVWCLFQPR